jgi:ABC-type nitrate/sulfonate/bicarbonate transport system permease component
MMAMASRAQRAVLPVTGVVALAALWEGIAEIVRPQWLPSLHEVVEEAAQLITSGELSAAGITVTTLLLGLSIVFVASAVLAASLWASPTLWRAVEPMLNATMATPNIALIPAFALIWGFSTTTRVVTVVSFALVPTILTWTSGLRESPADLREMAHSFGASRSAAFRTVVIPAAAPVLLVGVRLAVVQGIKGIVAAEMLTGVVGIGRLLIVSSQSFEMAQVYALVLILVLVSCGAYAALRSIESRWRAR